jgi:hypothetical protein
MKKKGDPMRHATKCLSIVALAFVTAGGPPAPASAAR